MNTLYLFMYLSFNLPVINNSCFHEQYKLLTADEVYNIKHSVVLQQAYKLHVLKHCV